MSNSQLFRSMMIDFAIGATLGGVFVGLRLFFNFQHLLDAVQGSGAPKTLGTILVAGCSTYFGFGVIITGFHFAVTSNEAEES